MAVIAGAAAIRDPIIQPSSSGLGALLVYEFAAILST
jgi:hypothetical protein